MVGRQWHLPNGGTRVLPWVSLGHEPFGPERWEGDHQMKAGVDAPEPALEQGGEGSGVASGSGVAGFFSAPVGRWAASHMPVDTAQNSANAMTRMRRSSRPGSLIWLSSSPKPRLLKSENRGRVGRRSFTSGLSQNGAGASRLQPLPPSTLPLR